MMRFREVEKPGMMWAKIWSESVRWDLKKVDMCGYIGALVEYWYKI